MKWNWVIYILVGAVAIWLASAIYFAPNYKASAIYIPKTGEFDEISQGWKDKVNSVDAPAAGPDASAKEVYKEAVPPITTAGKPPDSVLFEIDKACKDLEPGFIVFNPVGTMRAGITERIEVRIARHKDAKLTAGLVGHGTPTVAPIQVGVFMRSKLQGTEIFDIRSLSDEEQLVPVTDSAQWSWDVTPNKSGQGKLQLLVTVRVAVTGYAEGSINWPVMERDVAVNINPVYSVKRLWKDNWKSIVGWFFGGAGAAFLGKLWHRNRKSKKKTTH